MVKFEGLVEFGCSGIVGAKKEFPTREIFREAVREFNGLKDDEMPPAEEMGEAYVRYRPAIFVPASEKFDFPTGAWWLTREPKGAIKCWCDM